MSLSSVQVMIKPTLFLAPEGCTDRPLTPTGVVGLTTAVKIQEKTGYKVTIIAEYLPTDPKCIKYTSLWAVSPIYFQSSPPC
jgi:hypothetical protein